MRLKPYCAGSMAEAMQLVRKDMGRYALAAGDLLSTGSLTVPTPLRRGQTYVARFGDLQTLSVTVGHPPRAPARVAAPPLRRRPAAAR